MTIIIFIIILALLVFVHELGHFLIAKMSGIRVDEFGLGFPPKLWSKKVGETVYSLNAVPFGGFVKIFGENPDESSIHGPDSKRSFVHKPKPVQIAVLIAGIAFNLLFAWLLISAAFMSSMPVSVPEYSRYQLDNQRVMIVTIAADSPAAVAGIKPGDVITDVYVDRQRPTELTSERIREFIANQEGENLSIAVTRGEAKEVITVVPRQGVVEGKAAIGVSFETVGDANLPVHSALYEGAKLTWNMTKLTAVGLADFIKNIFTGEAAFSQVTGPVGIAGMVGDARSLGFVYLLSFTAIISINLAIINLVPFPALDGGRILFVLIEAVSRRKIKPVIANTVNAVGFALLLFLMVVVTYKDIVKLF